MKSFFIEDNIIQVIFLLDTFERLILYAHHPSRDENAGMDLYDALQARQVSYVDMDAAVVEEYVCFGKRVTNIEKIFEPDGVPLFQPR